MPVFVVCVCTRRHSSGLLDCLASIGRQKAELDSEVKLVVVDNDLAPLSQGIVGEFGKTSPFEVHYACEPRIGIPFARNRALEEAIRHGADWILFIDDDEVAEPGWLAAFQEIARSNAAQVAVGPVYMQMPDDSPTWLAIDDKVPKTNRPLKRASTANVMLDAAIVRSGLRFDERMRFTGDSDTDFFTRAARGGARIVGDLRPRVRERVPASRLTFRAMCLRGMRVGRNYLAIHRKLDGIKGVVVAVLPKVLGHLIEGVAALLLFFAWLPFDRRRAKVSITKSITRFCWVVGVAGGFLGVSFEAYPDVQASSPREDATAPPFALGPGADREGSPRA